MLFFLFIFSTLDQPVPTIADAISADELEFVRQSLDCQVLDGSHNLHNFEKRETSEST